MCIRRMEILFFLNKCLTVKSWYFHILARSPRLVSSGSAAINLVHPRCSYLIINTADDYVAARRTSEFVCAQRGSGVRSYVSRGSGAAQPRRTADRYIDAHTNSLVSRAATNH